MAKTPSAQEDCQVGDDSQSSQVPEVSTESTRSNSPLRRKLHIRSEQRRREKITDGFQRLRNCVPSVRPDHDSKALILKKSAEYIEMLEYELTALKHENAKMAQQLATCLPHHSHHHHTQHQLQHPTESQHQRHHTQPQELLQPSPTQHPFQLQPQSHPRYHHQPHFHHQQQQIERPTQHQHQHQHQHPHQNQVPQQYPQIPPVSIASPSFPSSYPSYASHQVLPAFPYGTPQPSRAPTLGLGALSSTTTPKFDLFYPPTAPNSRHIADQKDSKPPNKSLPRD